MSYECIVLADSLSPSGVRLTTMQVTFPRFILAEFNTHRMLSRNAASSRAIPVKKRIEQVENDPFVPEVFGRNITGMQAASNLDGESAAIARQAWLWSCREAIRYARALAQVGVHKQLANRVLEPYTWVSVVVTATEWDNFFHLRCHPDAQPEFQRIANMMYAARSHSEPRFVPQGSWHLPYIPDHYHDYHYTGVSWVAVSTARCARVSYKPFDSDEADIDADMSLYKRLLASGHMSPFEHPATPTPADGNKGDRSQWYGNLYGWMQHRKLIEHEEDMLGGR